MNFNACKNIYASTKYIFSHVKTKEHTFKIGVFYMLPKTSCYMITTFKGGLSIL